MLDRILGMAGKAFAAGEVVERHRVRIRLDRLAALRDHALVVARDPEVVVGPPVLPAVNLERLAGCSADREHHRSRLLGERGPHGRPGGDVDQRTLRRIDRVTADLEARASAHDEVELVLVAFLILRVLGNDAVADVRAEPRVDAERGDAELVPHPPGLRLLVTPVVEVVEARDLIPGCHQATSSLKAGSSRTESKSESSRASSRRLGRRSTAVPRWPIASSLWPASASQQARL